MRISLIVAMSENRVIGREGQLPWRLSADLRRFKQLTMGHHLIMGRKTFESIGRVLPGRTSIVVTRQPGYRAQGVVVAPSLTDALRHAEQAGDDEAFVIGGGEIYRQILPATDRIYLTLVKAMVDGDTRFDELDYSAWKLVASEEHPADEKNAYNHSFRTYDRVTSRAETTRKEPIVEESQATIQELLNLSQQLLNCVMTGDWQAYIQLCDASLTCFEPEARGQLVEGLQFHQFYFELGGATGKKQVTITQPHVRLIGTDGAVVCYVRLTQSADANGDNVQTSRIEETRVWQKRNGAWKHVHFHRSANA